MIKHPTPKWFGSLRPEVNIIENQVAAI